jgi:hypothetical protein
MTAPATSTNFYCSKISRRANERMFGTGGAENIWILLEYQKPWGRDAIEESELSDDVKKFLRGLKELEQNISVLFIKKNSRFVSPFRMFIVFPQEQLSITHEILLDSHDDLLELNVGKLLKGEISIESNVTDRPFYLVCTHGKRDKCCAKYGFATYKHMTTRSAENVWQCSHVGGDRFAANVVSFPHGIYYGHVSIKDADQIIDASQQREIFLKNYRGRSCYSRPGQVAEYFIRKTLGVMHIDDVCLETIEEQMRHISAKKSFEISFSRSSSNAVNFLTCRATVQKSIEVYTLKSFETV